MITKKTTFIILLLFAMMSCTLGKRKWTIDVNLLGDFINKNDKAYLYTVGEDYLEEKLLDSASIDGDRFVFYGKNKSDKQIEGYAILLAKGNAINYHVLVKNGEKITIEISPNIYKNHYSGSKTQDDYMRYLDLEKSENKYTEDKSRQYQNLNFQDRDTIKNFMLDYQREVKKFTNRKRTLISKINIPELASFLAGRAIFYQSQPTKSYIEKFLNALSDKARKTKRGRAIQYLYDNYESYNALQISASMGYQGLKEIYKRLGKEDKNSSYGKQILKKISKLEAIEEGASAPKVLATDIDGNSFDMDTLKAKIIILDFWASWCVPCRKENINYTSMYKKYKSKGLEIVAYSIDTDKSAWQKAIFDDGLDWIQVSKLDSQDPVLSDYNITQIPANFIIEDKKIAASDLFGDDLENFLKNKF